MPQRPLAESSSSSTTEASLAIPHAGFDGKACSELVGDGDGFGVRVNDVGGARGLN